MGDIPPGFGQGSQETTGNEPAGNFTPESGPTIETPINGDPHANRRVDENTERPGQTPGGQGGSREGPHLGPRPLAPNTPHRTRPEGTEASRQENAASGASAQTNVPPEPARPGGQSPNATQSGSVPGRPDAMNNAPSGHNVPPGGYQGPSGQTFQGPSCQAYQGPSSQTIQGPSCQTFLGLSSQTFQGPIGQSQSGPSGQTLQGPAGQGYQMPSSQGYGNVNGPGAQQFSSQQYGTQPSGGIYGNEPTGQAQPHQYYASQYTISIQGVPQGIGEQQYTMPAPVTGSYGPQGWGAPVYQNALELQMVGGSVENSPFVSWIQNYPLPKDLKYPSHLGTYKGKSDPGDFLEAFEGAAEMKVWNVPIACRMFRYTLE
uniref:protein SSXT-like n=1 Tax=Erigeron canadensis TaxID=72917 RepID=UPI001CB899E6|nr:protein SSXT-like [Erigeron canadensis]